MQSCEAFLISSFTLQVVALGVYFEDRLTYLVFAPIHVLMALDMPNPGYEKVNPHGLAHAQYTHMHHGPTITHGYAWCDMIRLSVFDHCSCLSPFAPIVMDSYHVCGPLHLYLFTGVGIGDPHFFGKGVPPNQSANYPALPHPDVLYCVAGL